MVVLVLSVAGTLRFSALFANLEDFVGGAEPPADAGVQTFELAERRFLDVSVAAAMLAVIHSRGETDNL